MKVILLNGSPHANGNTYIALHEMEKTFAEEGIETEIVHIGNKNIRGCIACRSCAKTGKCVFEDEVNAFAAKFEACDGLVIGSPVYYASANATLVAFLTRLFFSTRFDKTMKVGASVVAFYDLRHAGCFRTILEQYSRQRDWGGRAGSGRSAEHAHSDAQHVISDQEYRTWKGSLWNSAEGADAADEFYPIR